MVTGMSLLGTLGLCDAAVLAVVIMKTSEVQAIRGDLVHQGDNLFCVILVDAGAVHAGINIQKNSDPAAAPLPDLLCTFGQDGNLHAGKLRGDCLYALGVCAYRGIG